MDPELYQARKMIEKQKNHILRLQKSHLGLQRQLAYFNQRVKGECHSWRTLSRSGGALLKEAYEQLRARGSLRRRITMHLAAIGVSFETRSSAAHGGDSK